MAVAGAAAFVAMAVASTETATRPRRPPTRRRSHARGRSSSPPAAARVTRSPMQARPPSSVPISTRPGRQQRSSSSASATGRARCRLSPGRCPTRDRRRRRVRLRAADRIAPHADDHRRRASSSPRASRRTTRRTVAAFRRLLPLESKIIHVRWSGEAGWIPFGDLDLGLGPENATSYPHPGEIVLYPGGVSETEILLAYGYVNFASKAGQLAGNHFATIVEGNENLRPLGGEVPLGRARRRSSSARRRGTSRGTGRGYSSPTPALARPPDDLVPDREVPGRDPVRLEDHDVRVRLTAWQLARRRSDGAPAPRASRAAPPPRAR